MELQGIVLVSRNSDSLVGYSAYMKIAIQAGLNGRVCCFGEYAIHQVSTLLS
jgi:hypothetical protein